MAEPTPLETALRVLRKKPGGLLVQLSAAEARALLAEIERLRAESRALCSVGKTMQEELQRLRAENEKLRAEADPLIEGERDG